MVLALGLGQYLVKLMNSHAIPNSDYLNTQPKSDYMPSYARDS